MATFFVLLGLASILTMFALKWRNLPFSIAATLSWFGLWLYNLNYPPTNITAGTIVYDVLFYALLMMTVGVMVIYIVGRKRAETTKESPSIMEMSPEEYRGYIRSRRGGGSRSRI